MRKAKYISECCDVCGEYVLSYEQVLMMLVGGTGVVSDVFFAHGGHEGCAQKAEMYLEKIAAKRECDLEVQRVDFEESANPRLELVRRLRKLLTSGMAEIGIRQRLLHRIHGLQILRSHRPGLHRPGMTAIEERYKRMQLDDVCNLKMLQKILSLTSKPKVTDWGDHLTVEDSDRLRNGIATQISSQLATLVNSWGMDVVDAMLAIQKTGISSFEALTQLENMIGEFGLSVSEVAEVAVKSLEVKVQRRL